MGSIKTCPLKTSWLIALMLAITTSITTAEQPLRIRQSPVSGLATSVTSTDGGPILLVTQAGHTRVQPADFFNTYGALFGIVDAQIQLKSFAAHIDSIGQSHTSFQQLYKGVPVFSGIVKVHQNKEGQVLAVNGNTYDIKQGLPREASLTPFEAESVAVSHTVAVTPMAQTAELVVVDPGWYGDPPLGAHLAYHVVVGCAISGVLEAFFIDAINGAILDQWSLVYHDRDRRVFDGEGMPNLPGTLTRSEGDPPAEPVGTLVADDINRAYDYMGDVYAFFINAFGRDSLDNNGLPLISTANSTALGSGCPSAFFSSDLRQVVFCLGRVPDDVVGHEFTHGLTTYTANFIYQNQGGSLHEHFSFVFGETIDLYNSGSEIAGENHGSPEWSAHPSGIGIDEPNNMRTGCSRAPAYEDGVRWLYNEDRIQYEGAVYDYWDPTCFGHPDRAMSPLQTCRVARNGGTHIGAEIPNHAYALLTDGGSFNNITVEGVGLMKSANVWYRALTTYLTPGADFQDAYWSLNRAAADLIGTFPNDPRNGEPSSNMFTAADADQVDAALRAVELFTPGYCGRSIELLDSTPPPECSTSNVFLNETFESGLPGDWTISNSGPPTAYNWNVTDSELLPFDRAGRAAFCPDLNTSCLEGNESGLHSLVSPAVTLPAALTFPVLEFIHLHSSEPFFDGGNLKISIDGGRWQLIPPGAIYFNSYPQVLLEAAQGSTNPLAGEPAFSGGGGSWGTSVVHLGSFVSGGERVQIRFDFGKDYCGGNGGWYVDDIRIYDCLSGLDCDNNGVLDDFQTSRTGQPDVVVEHTSGHSERSFSDADPIGTRVNVEAERFVLLVPKTILGVRIFGGYYPFDLAPSDHFTVVFHASDLSTGLPGDSISLQKPKTTRAVESGFNIGGVTEWEISLELAEAVNLPAGTYWIEVFADTAGEFDSFVWSTAEFSPPIVHAASANQAPGADWAANGTFHHAITIEAKPLGADCNNNGSLDGCDINNGTSPDENNNLIPDECEPPSPRRPGGRTGG